MFQYEHETEWVMPQEYPDLSDAREVAIDLETYDPHLKTKGSGWATGSGHVIGVAVASDKGQWYFPIRHQNGPNLDPKMTLRWVKDLCSQEHTTFVFHNAMYDMGWLKAEGIEIKGRAVDTMIAAPLIDENRFSYALNALGRDYLNETKSERLLTEAAKSMGLDPKSEMYKLPAHFVGDYAEQDAAMALRLWRHLRRILETESLMTVFELETSVLRVILAMRERGVRVDMDKADSVKGFLQNEEEKILLDIRRVSGTEVSVWAAASVAKAFDAVGLVYPRTATGLPSFTKNFLANHGHELPKSIVRARELNKARTTFIDSITRFEHNGRIHADIHQLRSDAGGTVTGRFSYSSPNLQQLPSRDDFISPLIRGLFLPEPGTLWGSFDYSSQEPRLVVHYASLIHNLYREGKGRYSMKGADVFAQKYREDPRMDFHQLAADILGVSRKHAKGCALGIMYGMGVNKLSEQLGLDLPSGKELFQDFNASVPFVKELSNYAMEVAERNGHIRTLLGRKGRFDKWEPKVFGSHKALPFDEAVREYGHPLKRAFTYKTLNKLIQGSAADQVKKGMVDLFNEGILPMVQIHDELAVPVESAAQAKRIVEIMENCVTLEVPSIVDAEIGETWGAANTPIDKAFS
jgi:DNA polymerase I-like protein with 3'-5' exonuclease and polymerase domains